MSACEVTVWKGRLGASFSCFLGPVAAASYACICNLKLAGGWCGWSGWTLVVSLKAELELVYLFAVAIERQVVNKSRYFSVKLQLLPGILD